MTRAQPWVTSVGGTSLESDNPGTSPHPSYPAGVVSAWNVQGLCKGSTTKVGGLTGYDWCKAAGPADGGSAGGGGSSALWGMPSWQKGEGVISSYTTDGNGTTQCALATVGTPCREVPDVSADTDFYTPLHRVLRRRPEPEEQRVRDETTGRQRAGAWLVRCRRDKLGRAAVGRDRRRHEQLPGQPGRLS
jgi:hypothetical protein